MKKLLYISLVLALAIAGCRKVEEVDTYQVALGSVNVTTETDNARISASYTYEYTLKSVRILYAENEDLDGASKKDASFTAGTVTAEIGGLKASTTYFYKFEFDNGITRMWSEVRNFRTLDIPVTPELKVTTADVTEILETSAVCGGGVTYNGGNAVTRRGVCWAEFENPTIGHCADTTLDGGGTGVFTSHITGLERKTTYYVKAYAMTSDTTVYGGQKTFTTPEQVVYGLPTVVTHDVDEATVTQYSANLTGKVTDTGNKPITGCGFWYGTTHDTLGGTVNPASYSASGFSLRVSDSIEPNTTYYARAYAENELGRRFGNEVSFTTLSIPPTPDPQVFTLGSSDITTTSAKVKGRIYYDGTENPTQKGFVYGLDVNDLNNDADCTSQPDPFETVLTGLTPDTKYYYKAYARYAGYTQTFYGGVESFTTEIEITEPTITTVNPSNITTTTANSGGANITDGNSPIINKGVCWATFENPTLENCGDNFTDNGSGTADFTSQLTNLTPSTGYYVRAYAKNEAGKTGYGESPGFVTADVPPTPAPDVVTDAATDITMTSATLNGRVTDDHGSEITECWIMWGTSEDALTERVNCTAGMTFSGGIDNLQPNTDYYFKAFARNADDMTGNGETVSFTTSHHAPDVTTNQASGVSGTGATLGGSVTESYNCAITECWVMWGESDDAMTERLDCTAGTNFSAQLSGLENNRTYSFQAFAKNEFGETGSGEIQHFTTNNEIPEVETLDATGITATSATMNGRVNDDHGISITQCWFKWGRSASSLNNRLDCTAGANFSGTVDTLQPNTAYYFVAYARNANGQEGNGEVKQLTTSPTLPTVTTSPVTDVTQTTASGGGNVISDGGATVTARGVCWSTSQNPTTSDPHTTDGGGTGTFASNITGLTPNTVYHVRAYATNSVGTNYGEDLTFTTLQQLFAPTVVTDSVGSVTQTTAIGYGNVTSDGNATVTDRGICWGTSHNPTTANSHASGGSGTGTFSANMAGLTANTTYYVRAYATNSVSTSYGEELTITTLQQLFAPTVVTSEVTEIAQTTATGGGTVTNDGNATVTARGVCWGTSPNPTISDSHTTDGTGTGTFTSSITGLTANTTYYVRAYATNSVGTSYGDNVTFMTLQQLFLPTVLTSEVTNIAQTTATGSGTVTNDGNATVTARGVCWSTSQNPTISDSHTTDGTGTGTFTSSITGLTANTTYYVRAYATNSVGTSYGDNVTFTTLQQLYVPTVVTDSVGSVTQTTAIGYGNVTFDGNAIVTERGICWGTSQNPTTTNNHLSSGSGTGTFSANITGLTQNTTYYVRAYATNSVGTSYGDNVTFTTLQQINIPTVITSDVSNIEQTTATCGGNVTNGGGATVTARGVCWSTSQNPTISNSHTTNGTGTGNFTSSITGLTANTTYYVRAYATNSAGTGYGEQKTFTTSTQGSNRLFSVSATTKVYISPGNLQYKASTDTWRFAENQYDIVGAGNANISPTYDGWIDLFGWGTSGWDNGNTYYHPYDNNTNNSLYGPPYNLTGQYINADWGVYNTISNSTYDDWRTLTHDELSYLYSYRNDHTYLQGRAIVNDVRGFIFLPDDWEAPSGIYFLPSLGSWSTSYNNYTVEEWTIMENAGAVFWPVAGKRVGTNVTEYSGQNFSSRYWDTDFCSNLGGGCFYITTNNIGIGMMDRGSGISVRLVRDYSGSGVKKPVVTTNSVSNIAQNTATSGGNVIKDFGATVTARGICWSTSPNPTISNSHTSDGSGTGAFTSSMTGLAANTVYYVRAYATNSAGTGYGNAVTFVTYSGGGTGGHEFVDLGLPSGLLWATCNVGASSPEGYGDYFSWGELTTKSTYKWSTYEWCNGTQNTLTKYNTDPNKGTVDNKIILEMNDDVAHCNWGYGCRMPTCEEMFELTSNCTWAWVTQNGVRGRRVTGPNGNSIFLPAAGYYYNSTRQFAGTNGYYWTSSLMPSIPNWSHDLFFNSSSDYVDYDSRYEGLPVRPVCPPQGTTAPTVITSDVSNIEQTTATCGGNVTNDGGATVTARGVCWSTSPNPTTSDSHTTDGSGTGTFTSSITGLTANTTYYVRAYATNSAGTGYGEQKSFTTQSGGGGTHNYVDLGLSVLWATCNVGAENPEDYGNYYAWGETAPKSNYTWATYQWCNGDYDQLTKYCTNSSYGYNGFVDNKTVLELSDDAARANWGGDWRMPTRTEMEELKNNCTWTWTTQNGKNGYRVTCTNGNSIFLPVAGNSLSSAGFFGDYWSSSLNAGYTIGAYGLFFNSSNVSMGSEGRRFYGLSVRPVCPSQK